MLLQLKSNQLNIIYLMDEGHGKESKNLNKGCIGEA